MRRLGRPWIAYRDAKTTCAVDAAHPVLKEAIADCEAVRDYVSRELLEEILDGEEEHINWLETQLELIGKMGLQNWLQSQAGAAS
jgi:bacterioferritin